MSFLPFFLNPETKLSDLLPLWYLLKIILTKSEFYKNHSWKFLVSFHLYTIYIYVKNDMLSIKALHVDFENINFNYFTYILSSSLNNSKLLFFLSLDFFLLGFSGFLSTSNFAYSWALSDVVLFSTLSVILLWGLYSFPFSRVSSSKKAIKNYF